MKVPGKVRSSLWVTTNDRGLEPRHYYLKVSKGRHPGAVGGSSLAGSSGAGLPRRLPSGRGRVTGPEAWGLSWGRGKCGSHGTRAGSEGKGGESDKTAPNYPVASWRAASERSRAVTAVSPGLRSPWKPSGLLASPLPRLRAPGQSPPSSPAMPGLVALLEPGPGSGSSASLSPLRTLVIDREAQGGPHLRVSGSAAFIPPAASVPGTGTRAPAKPLSCPPHVHRAQCG